MVKIVNSEDFMDIFQKLFQINIKLEYLANDLLNHENDNFQIYAESYFEIAEQVGS